MENITDFEDILIDKYGKKGTERRDKHDAKSLAFRLGVIPLSARFVISPHFQYNNKSKHL